MSAARHAKDANYEAQRLHVAIQDLCERNALGENITAEQLSSILRASACVQYNTARTQYAVTQFGERRAADVAVAIPALASEVSHG